MTNQNIKKLVVAALLTAMTCMATSGAPAAGIGSMFSDIFSGYAS